MAIYGERVSGLPLLLDVLHYHPNGLTFEELAEEVGRTEADVRETLRVYHLTDLASYLPNLVARPDVVEFFGGDPDDDGDALRAPRVRLASDDPGEELGVGYASLTDLGRLYRVGTDAELLHPDDAVLASAVSKLHDSLLPSLRIVPQDSSELLAAAQAAIVAHRRIRVRYSRFWSMEMEDSVVEPLWLIRTRRGWTLDTTPGDQLSPVRTYFLDYVRELEVLDEEFEPPANLPTMIARHRTPQVVLLDTPHEARWAVDKFAEKVELIADGAHLARLRVFLLQPHRKRLGLMLVAGGPSARVLAPAHLRDVGIEVAARLLERYRVAPKEDPPTDVR